MKIGTGLGWTLLQKRHVNSLHISEKIFITNHQRDANQNDKSNPTTQNGHSHVTKNNAGVMSQEEREPPAQCMGMEISNSH